MSSRCLSARSARTASRISCSRVTGNPTCQHYRLFWYSVGSSANTARSIIQTLFDESCEVKAQSTVPRVGRYWVPCTPGFEGWGDAPDRRKIGKGIRGSPGRLVSISKAGIYATPVNDHSAKPERSCSPCRMARCQITAKIQWNDVDTRNHTRATECSG